MPGYTQTNRILRFNSPLGANTLLPMSFQGTEAFSELFDYKVDLLAELETVIVPSAIVGKRVTVELQVTDSGTKRYFNGIVANIEGNGGSTFFNSYRLRMVPMLWLLSLNRQTRVFQDMSVLNIARKVLSPYSITPHLETQASYQVLEYCTQYRETDLEFLSRILEQHGIFFYFTHSVSDHVLVLSDTSSLCGECSVVSEFDFNLEQERQLSFYKPTIFGFQSRSMLIPGEHTSWDYRFMRYDLSHASPQTLHSAVEMGENSHEVYDYADSAAAFFKTEGAESKTPIEQTQLQNAARDAADAQAIICHGESTASTMQAGFTFKLQKYPQSEKNLKYLLTRVTHSVQQQPGYRAEVDVPEEDPYKNTFEARPFSQVYRSARSLAKPRVSGVVTGKVVTFPGEDSHLDRFGRVCVQFWWDHRPPQTSNKNPDKTLLRVAQQWAGKEWGTYFWPRVGDEVLIDFIEGDPDAPIVVGSLYNGVNMPKYDPRTEYTRSGILTRSSLGGSKENANELRLEDKMGSEQIFLKAERDIDHRIKHDSRRWVGNQDSLIVVGDRLEEVQGSQHTTVTADVMHRINGSSYKTVANEIILQAGVKITLRVDESFLTLGPEGVEISGPLVRINSGGTPGVSPGDPKTPDEADDGTEGGKMP